MPANKKYLSSPGQRVLKISAAFVGAYAVTMSFHWLLLRFLNEQNVLVTGFFFVYIIWACLMIVTFLSKNGWKVWAWFLAATLLFSLPRIVDMLKQ